ncbi:farnesyl cysteine-carboxyl methyltransferase [Saxophila tyrrhenica]|uniref:Protein-S-isoprenylcysteine O-methyltransferase n=1 Tax=Saxophila tyrrhenica TaxID=1690608 RepID=A0AAV9PL03_9PEZI|nr:farnesyl cysteine-carboxyl methyltransferase [Saxophila tyrrhenica]
MARKSVSSSANGNGNGHLPTTAQTSSEGLQASNHIPGTTRQPNEDGFDWSRPSFQRRALPFDPSLLPHGRRSLSSIALQSFTLGLTLAACTLNTAYLLFARSTLWRLPAFFACLSLFHFLEFWTTARFNAPQARASSFLLWSNGVAYNVAHTLATVEIIASAFIPWYQQSFVNAYTIALGVGLVALGQSVRTLAMAQAGTNFNHTPAKTKEEGHVLVTEGVYRWLRHPSYFGFFWWAFGTQVLVGNKVCVVGYLMTLWMFFWKRIRAEEITLVDFFGEDYELYRKRTGTGIPLIR